MKGQPHDPRIVEDGPSPRNAERHGIWRILTVSLVLAVIGLVIVAIIFF